MWLYVPLILAILAVTYFEEVENKKYLIASGIFSLLASGVGYVINEKYFGPLLGVPSYSSIKFALTDTLFERIGDLFTQILILFGWQPNALVISIRGVNNLLVLMFCFVLCVIIWRQGGAAFKSKNLNILEKLFCIFSAISFSSMLFLLIFTESDISAAYLVPPMQIMIVCVLIFGIKFEIWKAIEKRLRVILLIIFILYYVLSLVFSYERLVIDKMQVTEENIQAVEFLKKENLKFGYATFWNSGPIWALSNQEIEAANINLQEEGMYYFKWLLQKKLYNKDYFQGNCFIMLDQEENRIFKKILESRKNKPVEIIYDDGYYTIYKLGQSEISDMITQ